MAKISNEILREIQRRAELMKYGTITLHINETQRNVDVDYSEKIRYPRGDEPRPGQIDSE